MSTWRFLVLLLVGVSWAGCRKPDATPSSEIPSLSTPIPAECERDFVLVEVDTADFWHVYVDDRLGLRGSEGGQEEGSISLSDLSSGSWLFLRYGSDFGVEREAVVTAYAVSPDPAGSRRRLAEGVNARQCIGFPTSALLARLRNDEHLAFGFTSQQWNGERTVLEIR